MPYQLSELVDFRGDRLFNGAVNLGWFLEDSEKTDQAARSFVFHGPDYHGVSQSDVGVGHGHALQDTASFTRDVLRRCSGLVDQPFTLAIAGYGTGKSHLALTIAAALSDPGGDTAGCVLDALAKADEDIASDFKIMLDEDHRPCLVLALNGMGNFDLISEVSRQIANQLRAKGLDTSALENLRPRFAQAIRLIEFSNRDVVSELLEEAGVDKIEEAVEKLREQDERIYSIVHKFFADRGMPIRALGGESVKEVIDVVVHEYVGEGKAFRHLVILFDEFGRYIEFATTRSQIAGSGVLQDLYEGIQANANEVSFFGFIQFELNAYAQRIAPEFRNEMLRYVTRYQSARKCYLSINLETLIAHLLEKRDRELLDSLFGDREAKEMTEQIQEKLQRWFPQSRNHSLWCDSNRFHNVIRKGCWPLSPFSAWFLFYLAAAGQHLQERSALSLLGSFFDRNRSTSVEDVASLSFQPADLWSEELENELLSSEEAGQQGAIAHAYKSVIARHGGRFSNTESQVLKAIVLASKMGLQVESRTDARYALCELAGLDIGEELEQLQDEYNVIEWDNRFNQYDILGDALPRAQFRAFLKQRVRSMYEESDKAKLFARQAANVCDLLGDLECDFAEQNKITTKEWFYKGVISNVELVETHLKFAADEWKNAFSVDEARGTIIYCYVEKTYDPEETTHSIGRSLRKVCRECGVAALPILVVMLHDDEGALGQSIAELDILAGLSKEDRAKFGNLIPAHQEKMQQVIRKAIEDKIKERRYVSCFPDGIQSRRLSRVGTEVFAEIYKKPLSFPFDGFTTTRGNAANDCQELTLELLHGRLDYDAIMAKPARTKNRAINVLVESWQIYNKSGSILRRPKMQSVRSVTEKWDRLLQSDTERLLLDEAVRDLCAPPVGANLASAGLLLGTYVGARINNLAVACDGEQCPANEWFKADIFKKKLVDITKLQSVELVDVGEASAEWQKLLGEWEEAESHVMRVACYRKAQELKARIPIPPAEKHRYNLLSERALSSQQALQKLESEQNKALEKIHSGEERGDVGLLSWGAAELAKLQEQMESEGASWTNEQVSEMVPHIEAARQSVIQLIPNWLPRQAPNTDRVEDAGDWKHKMLNLTGKNLKILALDDLLEQLREHVRRILRDIETLVEAKQLIRDVRSWLEANAQAPRHDRVKELRDLSEQGKRYSAKLRGMSQRINMTELNSVRSELSIFLKSLGEAKSRIENRLKELFNCDLDSIEKLKKVFEQCRSLVTAFEGCELDVEDLRSMETFLQSCQDCRKRLSQENLTWDKFDDLSEELAVEAETRFGEEEALPWDINETIAMIVQEVEEHRRQLSKRWITGIREEAIDISNMAVAEANQLHRKVCAPPSYITEEDAEELKKAKRGCEERLDSLNVEWLIERFRELPLQSKKRFLEIASGLTQ